MDMSTHIGRAIMYLSAQQIAEFAVLGGGAGEPSARADTRAGWGESG